MCVMTVASVSAWYTAFTDGVCKLQILSQSSGIIWLERAIRTATLKLDEIMEYSILSCHSGNTLEIKIDNVLILIPSVIAADLLRKVGQQGLWSHRILRA